MIPWDKKRPNTARKTNNYSFFIQKQPARSIIEAGHDES